MSNNGTSHVLASAVPTVYFLMYVTYIPRYFVGREVRLSRPKIMPECNSVERRDICLPVVLLRSNYVSTVLYCTVHTVSTCYGLKMERGN